MQTVLLELKAIRKTFPGVVALDNVTFSLQKGEIHGLCGENGAGKSTLMKVLSGVYPEGTYEGEILLCGKPQVFRNVKDAQNAGIRIIHQELALVPELTVAENIFLGNEPCFSGSMIQTHQLYSDAQNVLEKYKIDLDPFEKVGNLGVGQQQMVEIAKALSSNVIGSSREAVELLILDEPTSALTDKEVRVLMDILSTLRVSGVASVYISHKLDEVLEITNRVTVLRDGKTIITLRTEGLTENQIVSNMVGRELTDRFPKVPKNFGSEVLTVSHLSCEFPDRPGVKALDDVNLSVRSGEILGLAGLMGSGRTELATALFGEFGSHRKGNISINGKEVKITGARKAIQKGMALLTEDRKGNGLVLEHSILHNTSLARLDKLSKRGVLNKFEETRRASKYFEKMRVKAPSLNAQVGTLSGGNQQKVVFSKWLNIEPTILILDEPTRGIDVGAKFEIYSIISELVSEGIAVILISSELSEILGMSHSVMVMHEGKISDKIPIEEASEEKIMMLATGTIMSQRAAL